MPFPVAAVAAGMGQAIIGSLKDGSAKARALAEGEAQKLATSVETVGQLLRDGEIDQEEAEALIDMHRTATEAVLASLEGVNRASARRATRAGLTSAIGVVDTAIGVPLVGTLVAVAGAPGG